MATIDTDKFASVQRPKVLNVSRLRAGAIGLFGVLFMSLANAAPITALTGNVPIAIAYGNGTYAPAGYIVATVLLTLFTVGYAAMARYVTTTGAFYGFVSQGLGQIWGMATGLLATAAYIVLEGGLIGIFAYFTHDALSTWFSWDVNWLLIALVGIVLVAIFGYYDIGVVAALLGFLVICELVLLTALALSVLFKGGGPNGLMTSSINPFNAFKNVSAGGGFGVKMGLSLLPGGSATLGIFFAFWSWVGYETTGVYGEESRNPRKVVPRASLIAVIGLGIFYTFVSWMVIAGNGAKASIDKAANNSTELLTGLAKANLGGNWITYLYLFLIVAGTFACALAFHNVAARYLYAFGREIPFLSRSLGATHPKHGSPHISSGVQSLITFLLTVAFYLFTPNGSDSTQGGFIYEYDTLAVFGTMAILVAMVVCSVSVIWYFQVKKVHEGNVITTGVVPGLGALGMLWLLYLLLSNLAFAGGAAFGTVLYKSIPWVVLAIFIFGIGAALWLRSNRHETFEVLGRTVLESANDET
jgi:amino acid transporter